MFADLASLLDRAVKAVPAAKYFWGVVAASVVVGIVSLIEDQHRDERGYKSYES
jgi:hypothetical protein